jgi:hypothetical protein
MIIEVSELVCFSQVVDRAASLTNGWKGAQVGDLLSVGETGVADVHSSEYGGLAKVMALEG